MKWANPSWLWALLALFPISFFMLRQELARERKFSKFISRSLWGALIPERNARSQRLKGRLWVIGCAFLILALARPQWGHHDETIRIQGIDLMVVLDVSNSMEVEDVVPTRLKKAKHLLRTLLSRLGGDRVGLVAFAGSSYLVSPLTTDLNYLSDLLEITGVKTVLNQGTDIGLALETALKALERGSENTQQLAGGAQVSSQAILLISDGEDQEEGALQIASRLQKNGTQLFAVGIGTEKGGPIPIRDDTGGLLSYKKDSSGKPIVSAFNPSALEKLVETAQGRYWGASTAEEEVGELLEELGSLHRGDLGERKIQVFQERFQWPLLIALFIFLWEISLSVRGPSPGLSFLFLMLCFLGFPGGRVAFAAPSLRSYVENEKGLKAYRDGSPDAARELFEKAGQADPRQGEFPFNRGITEYQKGDYDAALKSFDEAVRRAEEDPDPKRALSLSGQANYNRAQTLSQKKEIPDAIRSYLKAIEIAQKSQDPALEEDARKNIELLMKQQQKQEQQKPDQKQGDQKKQEEQEKQKQQQQQQKEQESGKPPQYSKGSQQQKSFQSKKLSAEDAERVMAELKNKEKQLQSRLRKQNGNPARRPKDW